MVSHQAVEGLSVLDNPDWHALNTRHARFSAGTSLAKRYLPQVAAYFAVADHRDAALNDLAQVAANDQTIRLFEKHLPPTFPGWALSRTFIVDQLVCAQPVAEPKSNVQIIALSESDVPDMLRLIELTHPGPFFPRTIELGHYVGIRYQEQLIAMAGERFYLTGYREISAICTAPEHQGKGYARLLTSRLINENWQHGDVPFLHVVADNASAYHLYESLHFRKRAELHITILTR